MKIPKTLSIGEETFMLHCRAYNLEPEREYRFCERMFRLDFAFPLCKVALEVDGGTWTNGGHSRGIGFASDCVKANTATLMGWRVFRATTDMVISGEAIDTIRKALETR